MSDALGDGRESTGRRYRPSKSLFISASLGGAVHTFRWLVLALPLVLAGAQARADEWSQRWQSAIGSGDLAAISKLAERGRNLNLADRRGRTALMLAAAKGDVRLTGRLLDLGAAVDERNAAGGTALMFAAQYDRAAAARLLLEQGADADIQAAKGWTALMIASLKGNSEVIEVLLEQGADPNVRDYQGFTPLMRAVAENHLGAVRLLLRSERIQVNATDERGIGALHLAAAAGHIEITRRLLAGGANPAQLDRDGNTARSLAEAAGHEEAVRLLETWPR